MPGLLRGMARVAVVAGTATAVSGRVARRQQGRWAANDAPTPQQFAAQQAPPAPTAETGDVLAQLTQLGQLKASGVLTNAEFEIEKSKILGS